MGKEKQLEVKFDNPVAVFYSGNSITGKVCLDLSDSMKVQSIKVQLFGEAVVYASKKPGGLRIGYRRSAQRQVYIDESKCLFGDATSSGKYFVLPKGLREYPFSFETFSNLPSSFESSMGYVRFWCRASLQGRWKTLHSNKLPLTMVGILNLNNVPEAFVMQSASLNESFGFLRSLFSCASGGLMVTVNLNRGAFVPGERIIISAEVSNYSTRRIRSTEAYLQQNLGYVNKGVVSLYQGISKIGRIEKPAIEIGQVQNWIREELTVPALPPTNLATCDLIKINYLLTFLINFEGVRSSVLNIPIIIGTVPREPNRETSVEQPSAPDSVVPSAPDIQQILGRKFNQRNGDPVCRSFSTTAPPSYEVCVGMDTADFGDDDNSTAEDDNIVNYRPLYPTYPSIISGA
ncbi:Arrestin domain-containing protein 3 [Trichinella patagoniensis]|uniref:Arrestin domain-containing protein 3 n=1 Tax=Trichinella patagoniensis TaxID=990121 RepID=A0A0V0ZY51_9BILA|nr:Arrestin domain-containing protein 3 [Trichinella patagoniensis]